MPAKRGRILVFEGLDGSGKTTAARELAKAIGGVYLTTPGPDLREIREEVVAALSTQEARQLFYQATLHVASEEAKEIVAAGTDVVIDRYYLSTHAYAAFRGSSLGEGPIADLLTPADVTFYIDVPRTIRVARLEKRGMSPADRETLSAAADEQLRLEHFKRCSHRPVGEFVRVEAGPLKVDEVTNLLNARLAELHV